MDQVTIDATNAVTKEKPSLVTQDPDAFILAVHKKWIEAKLDDFPRMCQVAMMQNKLKMDELTAHGNKGKYTDSVGWSNSGDMKWEFDIPQDLYMFMINLVYREFWGKDNERVKRAFMNAICRGDDPITTLMKVKTLYGSNKDLSLTKGAK